MSHRLWVICVCAFSFLTMATLAQGQRASDVSGLAPGSSRHPVYQYSAAYQDGGSASHYVYAPSPKAKDTSPQQSNSDQAAQGQSGNQNQSTNGTQNQNQTQTQTPMNPPQNGQGQAKEEAPPEKPQYLTYSVQKKSLEEQAKSGKTLAVDFKSAPAGASVTVDGYFVGHTPATAQIPVGKHLVSITQWGYETWSKELEVDNGKDLHVNPTLHQGW